MWSAYTPCPHVPTPSAGGSNADPIQPNFRCICGQMNGYSQTDSRPTEKNIRALLRHLGSALEYETQCPEPTWEEMLRIVEQFPRTFVGLFDDAEWPRS